MTTKEEATIEEGKRLKYKSIKSYVPICPDCDSELHGNNSLVFPYKCKNCNVTWKMKPYTEDILYYKTKIDD